MSRIAVTIDGKLVEVEKGATARNLAKSAGLQAGERVMDVNSSGNAVLQPGSKVRSHGRYRSVPVTEKG